MEQILGIDLPAIVQTVGLLGVGLMVFAESGIFLGLFLPGDSLLFTAGFLASQNLLNIKWLLLVCLVGAWTGDNVGYAFGRRVGPKIFTKEKSIFFNREHLRRSQEFYERHGGKTIVLARFMPIIRTFAPILAGVGQMRYPVFIFYNILGGALWVLTLGLGGYFLGRVVPDADKYILPIVAGIIVVSVSPTAIHFFREWRKKRRG